MADLGYVDHRQDPGSWAASLGVSRQAVDLLHGSDFIDLHLDLEVPVRVLGYDPAVRHGPNRRVQPWMGQTDYPRLREAGFTGVVYDIATNPFRPRAWRQQVTLTNIRDAQARIRDHRRDLAVVRTHADYVEATKAGKTAFFIAIQGGIAFSHDAEVLLGPVGQEIHRITLVHLTNSSLGGTSSPLGGDRGLTAKGKRFVELCNDRRILVDLAHSGKKTFWGAIEAHDKALPPIVSHTGVSGVHPHWRNIDDDQIRAIADRGGVVGVMYQSSFLAKVRFTARRSDVIDHLEHIIRVAGEDFAAIGTDYDGMIVPPGDLVDVTHHPRLVQDMLDRGWSEGRIRKILGANYLRVVRAVRPG